jgi:hypothetical protein
MREKCILLLLASNDVESLDSRAADEIREIDGVIRSAAHRDSFEPLQRSALRDSDITAVLNRYQPHILHISGHAKRTEGLILEDDNREVAKIGCPELVSLILSSTDDDRLRLVFFSFCYSEACTKAISTKVPYAIGVKDEISAESLLLFTHVFYEALASGRSVRGAFNNACAWLKTKAPEEFDSMKFLS